MLYQMMTVLLEYIDCSLRTMSYIMLALCLMLLMTDYTGIIAHDIPYSGLFSIGIIFSEFDESAYNPGKLFWACVSCV